MKYAYIKINKGYSGTLGEEHISFKIEDCVYDGYVSYADVSKDLLKRDLLKVAIIDDASEETVVIKLPSIYNFSKGVIPPTITIPKEMVIY